MVSSTMGVDTSTTNPRWRVGSIEVEEVGRGEGSMMFECYNLLDPTE
jgi:hypothetical protein